MRRREMLRVIRVLEYTFEDGEQMERVMGACAVPWDGLKLFGSVAVRSQASPAVDVASEAGHLVEVDSRSLQAVFAYMAECESSVRGEEPEEG
jgi:hypothetical protein